MRVMRLAMATLLCGCSPSESSVAAVQPLEPRASAAGPHVRSIDWCMVEGDRLSFQALFDIRYTKGTDDPLSRMLYQLDCRLSTGECSGAQLDAKAVESGKPLGMFGLGRMDDAFVVERTGAVTTIKWGVYRTFTVDVAHGSVMYVESGVGMNGPIEGRGEAQCKTGR